MQVDYRLVEELARELYSRALRLYPPDLKATLANALEAEPSPTANAVLRVAVKSIETGERAGKPICQDTGMQCIWVRAGRGVTFDGHRFEQALYSGVRRCTNENGYRKTILHPVTREKLAEQTGPGHPTILWEWPNDSDVLEVMLLSKGSGSENQGFHTMLVPADGLEGVKRFLVESLIQAGGQFCPPGIAGVGLGGTFDGVARLAKRALLRDCRKPHQEPVIAEMETELLEAFNATGIGPMGLGGDTTILGVNIEYAATHETQNPVALNLQCWAHRKAGVRLLDPDTYEFIWEFGGEGHAS